MRQDRFGVDFWVGFFLLLGVGLLAMVCSGCYQAQEAPELVQCEPSTCYLFRAESPPRGRMDGCEACQLTESEVHTRQAELGCPLTEAFFGCRPEAACSFPTLVEHWARIRGAETCQEVEALALAPSCEAPPSESFWTASGHCAGEAP